MAPPEARRSRTEHPSSMGAPDASSSAPTSSSTTAGAGVLGGAPATFPKDCKACSGAQHLLDAFSKFKKQGAVPPPAPGPSAAAGSPSSSGSAANAGASRSGAHAADDEAAEERPASYSECPPNSAQLGKASWTFLHTTAAYYPEQPTTAQQSLMRSMMEALAEFYPCSYCAEHLRVQIKESPPQVESARDLSLWLCKLHNEVNEIVGKPTFDCSKVFERWRDGPPDGSCDS